MMITAPRITLERLTPTLARRIIARDEKPGDAWHPEYPLVDELDPLRLLATSTKQDPHFTMYLIRRNSDGLAIGGFGFFGPPDPKSCVEFGYGVVPAARGNGFATEAVLAALECAAVNGAQRAAADTTLDNIASQRVLSKAGMTETHREGTNVYYELKLVHPHSL